MPRGKIISAPPSTTAQQTLSLASFSTRASLSINDAAENSYEIDFRLVYIRVTDCYKEYDCVEGDILPYRDRSFTLKVGDEVFFNYDRDPENRISLFTARDVKRIEYPGPFFKGKSQLVPIFTYTIVYLAGYLFGRRKKKKRRRVT